MTPLLKKPSGWIPVAFSFAMLAFILITIAISGIPTPQTNVDEGTGAHLFQIWLVLEFFMIAFFALKYVPAVPKQAFIILAIQIIGVLALCAPVFILHL